MVTERGRESIEEMRGREGREGIREERSERVRLEGGKTRPKRGVAEKMV